MRLNYLYRAKLVEAMSRLNRVSMAYRNSAADCRFDDKENIPEGDSFQGWLAKSIQKPSYVQ